MKALWALGMALFSLLAVAEGTDHFAVPAACGAAARAAEKAEGDVYLHVDQWFPCRRLIRVLDRTTKDTSLKYLGLVRPPDACVIVYTNPKGQKAAWVRDVANGVSNPMLAVEGDSGEVFHGKNTDWFFYPLNNNYHVYHFQRTEQPPTLKVSEQVIGMPRFNRFDYSVACERYIP